MPWHGYQIHTFLQNYSLVRKDTSHPTGNGWDPFVDHFLHRIPFHSDPTKDIPTMNSFRSKQTMAGTWHMYFRWESNRQRDSIRVIRLRSCMVESIDMDLRHVAPKRRVLVCLVASSWGWREKGHTHARRPNHHHVTNEPAVLPTAGEVERPPTYHTVVPERRPQEL